MAGTADNPLYDVSPFADMKAEDVSKSHSILPLTYHTWLQILQPPKAAPNQARLHVVPETALEMGSELGSGAFGTVYKVHAYFNYIHLSL